jgi:hypothetical protein
MPILEIPRNFADGTTLFESDIDDIRNALLALLNTTKLDSENFQANGISIIKLAADITDEVTIEKTTGGIQVIDDSILAIKIGTEAATNAKFQDASITTDKLAASTIITANINADAVTTVKILDGAVTTAKLVNDAVTTVKITDANVTAAKLAEGTAEDDWVLGRYAESDAGAVGTYRFLYYTSGSAVQPGSNIGGANLRGSSSTISLFSEWRDSSDVGSALTGQTWKYMGAHGVIGSAAPESYPAVFCVRIS